MQLCQHKMQSVKSARKPCKTISKNYFTKVTMKTNIISFLSILLVLLFDSSCFGQEKEFISSWEISISSGQSFVEYFDGFETAGLSYSRGLTIKPEITYDFSRYFSSSISLFFTTAHEGDKNSNYSRVFTTTNSGASVFNHYQTTFAPEIQFSPIKTEKHKLYFGVGPTFTLGNSLLSQSYSESSTTMAKNISEFGYQGTLGYKFSFGNNWSIGGNYIYNKNAEKTEHLLISVGYKINQKVAR